MPLQRQDEALFLAVLGQIGDPCSDRIRGRADVERTAIFDDGATVERVGAEDRAHNLGPTGANQPSDAENLTSAQ
jgi:hypothetical protein